MSNHRKVVIQPMDNITEAPVEELHEQIQMLQVDLEATRVRSTQLGVELTASQVEVTRLQDMLRKSRRGYLSKKYVEKVIRSEIPKTWCADALRVAKQHGLIGPDTMDLNVDLGPYGTAVITVEVEKFEGLEDDEARKKFLSKNLSINIEISGSKVKGNKIKPPINSWEEVVPDVEEAKVEDTGVLYTTDIPVDHSALYGSNEGRVAHLVPNDGVGQHRFAVCGTGSGNWQEASGRAEHYYDTERGGEVYRVCGHCALRARNLEYIA